MSAKKNSREDKDEIAFTLSRRLREIIEERYLTNKEVCSISKKLGFGITESLLSDLLNPEFKPRYPSYDKIAAIAEILDVSIDFLVGRTDVRVQDPTLQAVGKMSGLSDSAINKLYSWGELIDSSKNDEIIVTTAKSNLPPDELSNLIMHKDFKQLIDLIRSLSYVKMIAKNKKMRVKNRHMGIYKTRVLVNEFGSVAAYKFILNEIVETLKTMLIDIYNIDLTKSEVRDATQADFDDF